MRSDHHSAPPRTLVARASTVLALCLAALTGTAAHAAPAALSAALPGPPAAQTAAVAAPPAGLPVGRDVSSHDWDSGKTVNWSSLWGSGVKFAYVKATEGSAARQHYVNPHFAGDSSRGYISDYNTAKSVGMYAGAYAFARPDYGDPVGQADFFVDHAQFARDGKTLPPMLDLEWPYGGTGVSDACWNLTPSAMVSWIRSFSNEVEARVGRPPAIYTNVNWWNPCTGSNTSFGRNPLVVSSCNSSAPSVPGWGSGWTMWQYEIPDCGRGATGDWDVFHGTLADLAAFAGGTPPPPQAGQIVLSSWPNVVRGQNGPNVLAAQYLLRYHGYSIAADGDFGPGTESAVSSFQSANGLSVDGQIGPQTWGALLVDVKRGANSDAVRGLQVELNRYGYGLTVDGDFGGGTDAAVRSFQATHGLSVDGDAGPKTWQELVGTQILSLRAHANGEYVTAENAGADPLIANRTAIGPWEQFDKLVLSNGDIALLAHADRKIVTAENAGGSWLIANRDAVGLWEDFKLIHNGDGSVSLRALVNGEYVTAESAGADPLIANRTAIGPWEEFDLV